MINLALDIATNTGWSIIDENLKLIEYGSIQIPSSMSLIQRISFLSNEIERILKKFKPNNVFIEDLICGISGVKTLSYLGRLNGAAILTCSNYVNDNIYFFEPTKWKKNSLDGLQGMSKKWEVLFAVVKFFKFNLSEEEISKLTNNTGCLSKVIDKQNLLVNLKQKVLELDKIIKSKRNPRPEKEKEKIKNKISQFNKLIIEEKKNLKKEQKLFEKELDKLSLVITSKIGISYDIADSIAINICGLKHLNNKE